MTDFDEHADDDADALPEDPFEDDELFYETVLNRCGCGDDDEPAPARRHPVLRALVALACCIGLVALLLVPYGGVREVVDFFLYGASYGDSSGSDAVETAGSSAGFVIQKSFDYPKNADAPKLAGEAARERYFLANRGQLTRVKLQSPWQDCWAFAACAALESAVLKQVEGAGAGAGAGVQDDGPQLTGLAEQPDYSERHVAWFAHERRSAASGGAQAGEGLEDADPTPGTQLAGGDLVYADVQFTTSAGIVAEDDEPYRYEGYDPDNLPFYQLGRNKGDEPAEGDRSDARNRDWSLTDAHAADTCGVLVRGAHILPSPVKTKTSKGGRVRYKGYDERATAAIKNALVKYGAVAFSYRADVSKPGVELLRYGSGKYFSYDNWAQYDNSEEPRTNHAAAIVGWDDSYPKGNFSGTEGASPPHDGAWLVKNSWGSVEFYESIGLSVLDAKRRATGLDGAGFFWLSYYDHTICEPYAFEVAPAGEEAALAHVYQHDYLSTASTNIPLSVKPAVWTANVFEARGDERLYAVSARTYAPNSTVKLRVYRLPASGGPAGGTLVAQQSETLEFGGFSVIDLDEPLDLEAGERFAVAEQVRAPGAKGESYLGLETVMEGAGTAGYVPHAVCNKGETYVSAAGGTGEWLSPKEVLRQLKDGGAEVKAFGNAMVKAYTAER